MRGLKDQKKKSEQQTVPKNKDMEYGYLTIIKPPNLLTLKYQTAKSEMLVIPE